ncbi:MAG TPA: hypothetical protein VKI19_13640 [Acidimicrobiales bacterium]|nr:hypothetical protein [Acidimicrobiales bacterium]
MTIADKIRSRPRMWASAALVTAGLASGAILGTTLTAGASTTTTSTSSSSASSSAPGSTTGPGCAPPGAAAHPLGKTGTVTAVGKDSVTIDGTAYAVTSTSDIDKNGEAGLSDLKVGDKVTFSTLSSAATPTVDKLHAGSEALDRPAGPRPGGPPPGTGQPAGSSSSALG